jgi:hypothetical protein
MVGALGRVERNFIFLFLLLARSGARPPLLRGRSFMECARVVGRISIVFGDADVGLERRLGMTESRSM